MLLQNLQFMNFDFLNMLEEKALEDFEPEATEEDQAFCRESLLKILENYYKNNPDNP